MLFLNEDCMVGMSRYLDKHFDLAIVDPPYSDEYASMNRLMQNMEGRATKAGNYHKIEMQPPDDAMFDEIIRVSKNQIIWGVNWYKRYFGVGRIVWDKDNEGSNFSDCELAYQSFDRVTRKYRYRWNGMLQENMKDKEVRIHPYQKPTGLYKWLLTKYAKPNDLILDTHVGSASSLIACENLGFDYVGFELDPDYYNSACKRIEQYRSQLKLEWL